MAVSGPISADDTAPSPAGAEGAQPATIEVTPGREAQVGAITVRRALPHRGRRTVGAWCFADHMGPAPVTPEHGLDVGPHPHIGLQTVTWLVSGEVLHRDSLGSEQPIRPGQLNLMTAGRGVVHAEEATGRYRGQLHGAQLWVAQPEDSRHGEAAFAHHAELPQLELGVGVATVLVGVLGGVASPARRDSDLVGAELAVGPGIAFVPLDPAFEHAIVVLAGSVGVAGRIVEPGHLCYLGLGRDELALSITEETRALLLGGVPFPEPVLMWWNFVARTREEVDEAERQWTEGDARFGPVDSRLARIPAPVPLWRTGGRGR